MRRFVGYLLVLGLGTAAGSLAAPTFAAFTSATENSGNRMIGAQDWTPPTISAAAIQKASGGVGGHIKQSGGYFVFAHVSDAGNPSSGIVSVTADVGSVTGGSASVSMSSGSWSVDGVSYNRRTSQLTADVQPPGTRSFSVHAEDAAANSRLASGFSVIVDNTMPKNTDIQTQDGGGTVGKPEMGDRIFYTYDERLEPGSVMAGWSGASTSVVVEIFNSSNNDIVRIYDPSDTQLPLGEFETNRNYVTATARFGPSGTISTMVQSGGLITVTLGSQNSGTVRPPTGDGAILWLASAAVTDLAGNNLSAANLTEPGPADPDF